MAANTTNCLKAFLVFLIVHLPFLVLSRCLEHKNPQSFNTLLSLEGLSKGQTDKNLPYLRQYLKRFGYLNYKETTLNGNYFDEVLESAVKLYQRNYHLKVTGKLDFDTVKKAANPRCGFPDIGLRFKSINNGDHTNNGDDDPDFLFIKNSSLYKFFDGNPKWPAEKTHLTYTFISAVHPIPQEDLSSASSQAFAEWTRNSKFTFAEVREGAVSDLRLGFFVGDHGDGHPFDGPLNVLAHAFAPTYGRLHLDGAEAWSLSPPPPGQIDIVWVTMHEIGHLLGLAHSSDPNAVMFAQVTPGVARRALTPDDIAGIQALYATP
ncbi:metalloendoproteinase 3-MMP [Ziziphus jujuba]|uniref:Metalloendoproteinase 3-MMP n=1 Tax=Ziziphus jujuba TaxID=326968 RepID=A0ABM4A7V9_ZIZJJ|nr:metalloendoproteinase 3-MMP [Ziziphus jujuba]